MKLNRDVQSRSKPYFTGHTSLEDGQFSLSLIFSWYKASRRHTVKQINADESRFLQHHGGAVFFFARRQCPPHCGHRFIDGNEVARLDDAITETVFRPLVCPAGRIRRRICGCTAQGSRDVRDQSDQDLRLRDDVFSCPPIDRLCGRRLRRCSLLTGQIWHPDRIAAARKTGCGEWLDRRTHSHIHHPRHRDGRRLDQPGHLREIAGIRLPLL